ncbi:luciferase-like monooxygenase [Kutzneria buriramensis]|uniref:Luciferase-like monooxygenase n=1 Tax=Kutzneria buriramensis TaxID=1045776 RepID=A0A3E0HQA8_9PSEU|nr:luciferase-like monooxygenase [Kutzneria buriramensis]
MHAEADRVHVINHEGKHFKVRGPLNVPRSPQGHPLLVQAGSSEDGRDFAARHAEAVFTAQQTLDEGNGFYTDLKDRAARLGRDPEQVLILPGIVPVIGDTEEEARELDAAAATLSHLTGGRGD